MLREFNELVLKIRQRSSLEKIKVSRDEIISVYNATVNNIGDRYVTPVRYFDFLRKALIVNIWGNVLPPQLHENYVIVGGGGFLGNPDFNPNMELLARLKPKKLICWAVGHNLHGSKEIVMPDYLRHYDLVGVRDYGYGYEWVPCPSCLNPLFDRQYEIKNRIVIYRHSNVDISVEGFPLLKNNEQSLKKVLAFLGSAEIILTNTYHGAYWGILLNRKVIIVSPFSSRFHGFKYKVPIADTEDWQSKLKETQNYPQALSECRNANIRFAEKVKELLNIKNNP